MLIGRCAWHRQYHGYPLLQGVASWRGLRVRFTDGICERCLQQFRAEHRAYFRPRPPRREQTPAGPVTPGVAITRPA